jgi:Domain of unknown function (DUF4129)
VILAVDADRARDEARRILSERRFHARDTLRPFAGFFRRVGDAVVDPIRGFLHTLAGFVPDVGSPLWLLLAFVVVTLATVAAVRLSRNRGREHPGRGRTGGAEEGVDPNELDRRAGDAERRGELDEALRLRFRAGLARLDRLGVIDVRPGLTNAGVRRILRSPRFDTLAGDFDEVVYGGRRATSGDVETARSGWPRVVEEARRP